MKVLIHFEHADGTSDEIILVGDTKEEIRGEFIAKYPDVNLHFCWSEGISL